MDHQNNHERDLANDCLPEALATAITVPCFADVKQDLGFELLAKHQVADQADDDVD